MSWNCPFCGDCEACQRTLRNEDKLTKAQKRVAELEAGIAEALRDGLPCNIHVKVKAVDQDECRGCRAQRMLRSLLAKGGAS